MIKRMYCIPLLLLPFLAAPACVRPKLYRAELAARATTEGREKVLQAELADRKAEVARLTDEIGSLNYAKGGQEIQIKQLEANLAERTRQMGESADKLAGEKINLVKELATTKAAYVRSNDTLQPIQQARRLKEQQLKELQTRLAAALREQASAGVVVAVTGDAVTLLLPDKVLFEAKGLEINVLAKPVFTTLAILLTSRPELDAEVVAYTDNVLPKDRTMRDTWTWSLYRATNVVRALIQEYNVNANQLTPVGRGEFYPVASNETAEGRQQNRRTVIVLHPAPLSGK